MVLVFGVSAYQEVCCGRWQCMYRSLDKQVKIHSATRRMKTILTQYSSSCTVTSCCSQQRNATPHTPHALLMEEAKSKQGYLTWVSTAHLSSTSALKPHRLAHDNATLRATRPIFAPTPCNVNGALHCTPQHACPADILCQSPCW